MGKITAQFASCVALVLLPVIPAVCAPQRVKETTGAAKAVAANSSFDQSEQFAQRNPRYRIGRSDVLSLAFPLSPELNQTVTVQPDGFISLYDAGDIYIQGLTVPEVVDAVKKSYAGTLHEPIVNVDLVDFQKPFFTVLGQVGKPGQYDLRSEITVSEAIAVAGGLASTAKTQVFLYRAVDSNWAQVRELKLKDILHGKHVNEDLHLEPGDMIFVPESAITKFKKYVPYSLALTSPYVIN